MRVVDKFVMNNALVDSSTVS